MKEEVGVTVVSEDQQRRRNDQPVRVTENDRREGDDLKTYCPLNYYTVLKLGSGGREKNNWDIH